LKAKQEELERVQREEQGKISKAEATRKEKQAEELGEKQRFENE